MEGLEIFYREAGPRAFAIATAACSANIRSHTKPCSSRGSRLNNARTPRTPSMLCSPATVTARESRASACTTYSPCVSIVQRAFAGLESPSDTHSSGWSDWRERSKAGGSHHSTFAMSSEPRLFRSSEPIKTQVSTYRLCLRTSIWPFRIRTSRHGCGCTAGPSSTRPSSSANREA